MKTTLVVISIVIVGYLSWRWFVPTRKPAPKPVAAQLTIPKRHLAPEGTYFLLERASLTTNSGVIGFPPGTKVTLLHQSDSDSTVTDGKYQFTVPSFQLTNDLDIAATVAKSDYAAQAQLSHVTAKSAEEYDHQQSDALAALEKEETQRKTRHRAASRYSNPLERGSYHRTQDQTHTDTSGRTYWIDVSGHRHYDNN
jgi:hypothetical protein